MTFFAEKINKNPRIYAYVDLSEKYEGLIRVGMTYRTVQERMKEHYPTAPPKGIEQYKVLIDESGLRNNGEPFKDHDVHRVLKSAGIPKEGKGEWFRCSKDQVMAAIVSVQEGKLYRPESKYNFKLRPEQKEAISKTKQFFDSYSHFEDKSPHFLWNCKMRFGKTFTAYKLAQEMDWKKVLVLTFKPAVENSWKEDLLDHSDFSNWLFGSEQSLSYDEIRVEDKPFVYFASFQDFLGKTKAGGIKIKNKWAHQVDWDCIILDEYHYGAWRESAKELILEDEKKEYFPDGFNAYELWNEDISPLTTKHYLYLSGTPFRAIESGEFIEEEIFSWTYPDEQKAKNNWAGKNNPYESLPRMIMMTYKMPESLMQILNKGEFDEFKLNEFFKAKGTGKNAEFIHKDEVQKWLDLIRGGGFENIYTNLKLKNKKPVLPFSDSKLKNLLNHTLWYLPRVSSCHAMKNLLMSQSNFFYHDYEIIVAAGSEAGMGVKALEPVQKAMNDPLNSKTITLTVGKLCQGVTVKPWSGIFFLRDTTSPESYFQTIFRVQSPWTIPSEDKNAINDEIVKKDCYVFDFAPNRALKLITDYTFRLNVNETNPEKSVSEFLKFLPVLSFDGTSMIELNAEQLIENSIIGTSGSQLAKAFESPALINVDNETLTKLMNNPEALAAVMKIEGFKTLKSDIETIINSSSKINSLKKASTEKNLSEKETKILTDEEKKLKSARQKLQERLQIFSARIPVFMYLTDFREQTLQDVITKLEPGLFKKVTSLTVKEFELIRSIGIFNSTLMNNIIVKFKRYEDHSLHYRDFTKHDRNKMALWDTITNVDELYTST